MLKYQWRETTEEGTRFYRATHHASRWNISTQLKGEDWNDKFKPSQEVLQSLRELLWAKYQRKRCTWKVLSNLDKLLEQEYGVEPPQKS